MAQKSEFAIQLFTAATPNGHKASVFLEELKAAGAIPGYSFQSLSFKNNEQKEPWFLKINPNGRIPAIVDHSKNGGQRVFETSSILLYLAKHYDLKGEFSFPGDEAAETETLSWMFFGHGGVGPMQGQANHFNRYAPEDIPYGKKRYTDETGRLYSVLDDHLKDRDYLVGSGKGKYSIADISIFPWVRVHQWAMVDIEPFPNVKRWLKSCSERPAAVAGVNVPDEDTLTKMQKDPSLAEKMAKEASSWIMKGNEKK